MFNVRVLLADAAQVVAGKLYILGGGWSIIVAGAPFAVCGKIDIPWHQGTDWHRLRLELVDGDGHAVLVPTDNGEQPLVVNAPPYRPTIGNHIKPGTQLDWPFAFTVPAGLPLQPGAMYEWRISINGASQDGWSLPFVTARAPLADVA